MLELRAVVRAVVLFDFLNRVGFGWFLNLVIGFIPMAWCRSFEFRFPSLSGQCLTCCKGEAFGLNDLSLTQAAEMLHRQIDRNASEIK